MRPSPLAPGLLVAGILLAGTAGVPSLALADEIYRWVDAQGRVHFSSTPAPAEGEQTEKWEASPDRSIRIVTDPKAPGAPKAASPPPSRPTSRAGPPSHAQPPRPAPPARPRLIGGRDERSWRREAKRLQRRVESLERSIESAEDAQSFPGRFRSSLSRARVEARQEKRLESLRAQLEQAEDDLDELETDAHQQGVPARWLY